MLRLRITALGLAIACCHGAASAAAPAPANPFGPYLARDYVFVDSPALASYLDSIVARLLATRPGKPAAPRVIVFSSEAFDAFSDGAGHLFVSTATLRSVQSEDELAALLGHELSHGLLRHPQQKESWLAFPTGIETYESLSATAKLLKGGSAAARTGSEAAGSLSSTYTASLLWNDILTPGWNRRQERAADETGFEMMRAAGYDPSAFGTLFQKLGTAAARRSERMEKLRQVMTARAQAAAKKAIASKSKQTRTGLKGDLAVPAGKLADELGSRLTEKGVATVIDQLAAFNQDYDTPDQRQQNLAAYAEGHRMATRPPRAVPHFAGALGAGEGRLVLRLDDASIRLLNALTARDAAGSASAATKLLWATSDGKARFAHLNFAAGSWYESRSRTDLAEKHSAAWLEASQPPARAYLWVASQKAARRDFAGALETLDRGRARIGDRAPFLPQQVTLAKASGRKQRAEQLTQECAEEDRRNAGMKLAALFRNERVPSGLYAECVARLGYEPAGARPNNAAIEAFKHPVQFGKGVTDKVRDKLRNH